MPDYIFFMHDDARDGEDNWEPYLTQLKASGSFEGGSAIGDGVCVRKTDDLPSLTSHLVGYIRVNADNLEHAKSMLEGNPHFEAGGTVEIRKCLGQIRRPLDVRSRHLADIAERTAHVRL